MAHAPHPLTRQRAAFFAVLAVSALTMISLLWLYPVKTLIVTGVLLAGLGLTARLARWIETDVGEELGEGEQRPS